MVRKINLKESKGNIDTFLFALQNKINELEDDNVYDESLTESFSNYDIENYLCQIEDEWGLWAADKMLNWLIDHSDNADDIFNEQGAYDVEQFEYWIGDNVIEKVMKHCLETGKVEDI